MSEIQIFVPDNDGEGTWESIDESNLDLSNHDAKIKAEVIDEFVKMAEEMNITYPHTNISDDEKEELAGYMHTSIIKSVKWIAEQIGGEG